MLTTVVSVAAYVRTSAANRETKAANDELKKALTAEQEQREHAENTSAAALEAMNRIYDRFAPNRIIVAPSLPADGSTEEGHRNSAAAHSVAGSGAARWKNCWSSTNRSCARGATIRVFRIQAAEANQRIGDIRQRLGQLEPAIAAYRKAIELYTHVAADERWRNRPRSSWPARTTNWVAPCRRSSEPTRPATPTARRSPC